MNENGIQIERAQNLWASFERKHTPLARAAQLNANPQLDFSEIGGLAGPKDEVLTYGCAATSPEVYSHWGTVPPSGILMIGDLGVGKSLLAEALATQTKTAYLRVHVPRLALDVVHSTSKVGEFVPGWSAILEEMPPLTIFFDELEFAQVAEIGERRLDLPIGPIMDFLLEIVDRSIAVPHHLIMGATSHPDTLRHAFVAPGRFERVVEVVPSFPGDVVEALQIHAQAAEKRAGRTLFEDVDWAAVVGSTREPSTGDWVRVLHAVLRRKARHEAAGDEVPPVRTSDLRAEAERAKGAHDRIHLRGAGNYV